MKKSKNLPFIYWVLTYLPLIIILVGFYLLFRASHEIFLSLLLIGLGVYLIRLTTGTIKAIKNKHKHG